MNDAIKNLLIWVVIAIILVSVFSSFKTSNTSKQQLTYTQFLQQVNDDAVARVTVTDQSIAGTLKGGQAFTTYMPVYDQFLLADLLKHNVEVVGKPVEQSIWLRVLISWLPFLLLIGLWIFFMRGMGGAGGSRGVMGIGRSKARLLSENQVKVTFADVAGCDEAKEEVTEVVQFLKDRSKFQKLGGTIPRGILLVGPPGTGKTLLAKAVAGEAKVPFFTISGSDFVEMFVGVGASRVRDMFAQAKKQAPCMIFIDEIDAVGRHRGAGLGGGHDEREQTLNQMLVEMDGFNSKDGVIIIAATNRPDVLDPALLRPGRFDRQVVVALPDIKGREQILQVHMRKVPLSDDVKATVIARGTPGFSGADLANLVNEAALFAARDDKRLVDMDDFEKAKDKIMMGAERKTMVMDDEEKKLTAYHEAGHAIVGYLMPEHDPVHKVTIIPRGRALGVTMFLPEQDRYSYSKQRLLSQLCSLYGGRIAEEQIFGEDKVTTGASNDIERATEIARNMVTKWGLSKRLGAQTFAEDDQEVFLGRSSASASKTLAPETLTAIDEEVCSILDRSYQESKKILEDNADILHAMADALVKYETINMEQIEDLMARRPVREPKDWNISSNGKTPQTSETTKTLKPQSPDTTISDEPAGQH